MLPALSVWTAWGEGPVEVLPWSLHKPTRHSSALSVLEWSGRSPRAPFHAPVEISHSDRPDVLLAGVEDQVQCRTMSPQQLANCQGQRTPVTLPRTFYEEPHLICWKLPGGGSLLPPRETSGTAWAWAGAMETRGEGDCGVQWSGGPLVL